VVDAHINILHLSPSTYATNNLHYFITQLPYFGILIVHTSVVRVSVNSIYTMCKSSVSVNSIYMMCKSSLSVNHLHLHVQISYIHIYSVAVYIFFLHFHKVSVNVLGCVSVNTKIVCKVTLSLNLLSPKPFFQGYP
jgi:hypothetical protein